MVLMLAHSYGLTPYFIPSIVFLYFFCVSIYFVLVLTVFYLENFSFCDAWPDQKSLSTFQLLLDPRYFIRPALLLPPDLRVAFKKNRVEAIQYTVECNLPSVPTLGGG